MAKRKVCKQCRTFVTGPACHICKASTFSTNWNGRIFFLDKNESTVAQNMGITEPGEYAIRVK